MMRFVIAGGGTGGHVYPAVALAERLSYRGTVTMLARSGSFEERIFLDHGLDVKTVRSAPLLYAPASLWRFARAIGGGMVDARRVMADSHASAFIGTGGYVSVPGIMAARMSGVPIYLLEQNAVMGRANRTFCRYARRVFLGFPVDGMTGSKFILSGNPLRQEVHVALERHRADGHPDDGLLFLGGSGGATFINDLFLQTVQELDARKHRLTVSVVTGSDEYKRIRDAVTEMSLTTVDTNVIEYEEHMEKLYEKTRVAVTRGGALALTELAAGGIFAIVIPYPFAVSRHQSRNAAYIENRGLGVCLEQHSFSFDRYVGELEKAINTANGTSCAAETSVFGKDAAEEIAETIERECPHD
jgi:UDP-N-acetylglucosamine--N-acetylmuramyl-(pentapeptide) pyrophosphoryl-undecaprenol N-acetylglucosamine transferase